VILLDGGTLVAIVDADDRHHRRCTAALRTIDRPLGTVWPAVADALQRLADVPGGMNAVLEMIQRGTVRLLPTDGGDIPRIRELLAKHRRQGMDLGDAALVRAAERDGVDTVFTLDRRPFQAYRISGRKALRVLPGTSA